MADGIYSIIALNSDDVLARRLEDSAIKVGVAMSEYNWHDFAQGTTWEIWEDDITLYYHGEVLNVVVHEGFGYVNFRVVGEPKTNSSRSD